MIEKIMFTTLSFILFIYVFLFKLIKKNDTTYISILVLQAIGILINLLQILFDIFVGTFINVILYAICILLPILVFVLEMRNINVSELMHIGFAKVNMLKGNNKKAKENLINLVAKYKNSYFGHKMLAEIYEQEGGMRKAIDEYVKVLDIKGNDYNSYYKISSLLNDLDKKSEAIEMLKNLLKKKPDMYEATSMLGKLYLDQNKYKQVIEVYTPSLKYYPEKIETYYNLGIAYSRINDFVTASECFKKVTELDDSEYKAYYRLGQIALLYRDYDVAEENFARSSYREKEDKAYYELSKIYIMKNQKEKAAISLNKAIELNPEYYNIAKDEPIMFSIKSLIQKPENTNKQNEFIETEEEKKIEEYLSDTYNLTQVLNKQKEYNDKLKKDKK